MTTDIDSDTPISHPNIDMIARTLIKTIETQTIDIKLYMMFLVAINKTTNEDEYDKLNIESLNDTFVMLDQDTNSLSSSLNHNDLN